MMSTPRRACVWWVLVLGLGLMLAACAKKKENDHFMEEWQAKADESSGKTYSPVQRKVEFSQLQIKPDAKPGDLKPVRSLPVTRVSLNFYNTDLQAVLRSMARIANQNIVLSASLQAPENQGKFKVNLNVSETPWDQAFNAILNANGLSYDWDGEIIRVMTLEDMKQQNAMKKALEEKMAQGEKLKTVEPVVTVKVQVNYADVIDMEKTLKGYLASANQPGTAPPAAAPGAAAAAALTPGAAEDLAGKIRGTVVADKHSNSIIIQATREHAELLVKLVEKLDEPRLQVHLKAFIVEATRQTLMDIGVQWGGVFRSGVDANGNRLYITPGANNNPVIDSTTGQVTGPPTNPQIGTQTPIFGRGPSGNGYTVNFPAALTPNATGFGGQGAAVNFLWGMLGNNLLQTQLTALAQEGKVNILSEPSLTTLDNMVAFTENGKTIPFVSTSQNGTNVQFIDAVLRLEMTPHVIDGDNLRLHILIKNDDVVTDQTQWVQGNPPINKKQTDTTLIVHDGETIIISGLAKHTKSNSNSGVPGFKDVPGLGYLFKEVNKSTSKDDLLVFITPTVLKPQGGPQTPPNTGPSPVPGGLRDRTPVPMDQNPAAPPLPMAPARPPMAAPPAPPAVQAPVVSRQGY